MREELESQFNSMDMVEHTTYLIYGSVMTTTRAFLGCEIRIDPATMRIFAKVKLRWWAKLGKFKAIRDIWMNKANKRVKEFVPTGFKVLVYYEGGDK